MTTSTRADNATATFTVYRSRVELTPHHPTTAAISRDAHLLCQFLRRAFHDDLASEDPDVPRTLYAALRHTPAGSGGKFSPPAGTITGLLVQSGRAPDWQSHQQAGELVVTHDGPVTHSLATGDTIAVRAWLNPTTRRARRHRPDTFYRAAQNNVNDIADWVRHHITRAGSQLDDTTLTVGPARTLIAPSLNRPGHIAVLRPVAFHATVTNPHQLAHTLTTGVGPAKAYGAGLWDIEII